MYGLPSDQAKVARKLLHLVQRLSKAPSRKNRMLYSTYEAHNTILEPWRVLAQGVSDWLHHTLPAGTSQASMEEVLAGGVMSRSAAAAAEERAGQEVRHHTAASRSRPSRHCLFVTLGKIVSV